MTTEAWRREHWGPPCQDVSGRVTVGGAVGLRVDARAVPAFRALADTFDAHGYDVHPAWPAGDTGTYNCRHIGGDATRPWSAHAWGTAIDVNWQTNPDGSRLVTDMPDALVAAVQQIVTVDGAPVWRWGGDWDRDPRTGHSYYDAMHFEVVATPQQIAAGIGGPPPSGGAVMRIAGGNRFATSVAVARHRFVAPPVVYLAADGSPDAQVAVFTDGPTLLVTGDGLSSEVAEYLAEVRPSRVVAVGGPGVVPQAVLDRARHHAGLT